MDDKEDLYGENYFAKHLPQDYGQPTLDARVRSDVPERNLFWLDTLLRYVPPRGKLLELGCFHGGFVALARLAGFEARGLELSPAMCRQAESLFGIEVLQGPVETHNLPRASLAVIAHFDVLEHLWDPLATMTHCRGLLEKGGVMLIQTPRYREGASYEEMVSSNDPFLGQLKPMEHLFLFSGTSVRRLMERSGLKHLGFEPAIFAHYDMFLAASPSPLRRRSQKARDRDIKNSANGRIVLALLDLESKERVSRERAKAGADENALLKAQFADLERNFNAAEKDRVHRGKVIEDQGARLSKLEAEFDRRLKELNALYARTEAVKNERNLLKAELVEMRKNLGNVEKERALRGQVIEDQGAKLSKLEAEFDKRLKELNALYARTEAVKNERNLLKAELAEMRKNLENVEKERTLRGQVIEDQGAKISKLEAEFEKRLRELNKVYETSEALKNERNLLNAQLADLNRNFDIAEKDRVHRGQVIEDQGVKLSKLEAEFDKRLKELNALYARTETVKNERDLLRAELDEMRKNLDNLEKDRALRGKVIEDQGAKLSKLEAEFDKRLRELDALYARTEAVKNERDLIKAQFADLERNFKAAEEDRAHRGRVIEELGEKLSNSEAELDKRLKELHQVYEKSEALKNERNMLEARLADLMRNFQNVERDREVRGRVIEDQGKALQESQRLVHLVEVDRDAWKGFHKKQEEMLAKLAAEIDRLRSACAEADQARDNWMSSALAAKERAETAEAALRTLEEKWWARAARKLGFD